MTSSALGPLPLAFVAQIQQFLADPGNYPPEFKNFITAWVAAFPPSIPFSQVQGINVATTYAEILTPTAVASGTSPVAVVWSAMRRDAGAMWSATVNQSRLTVRQAGVYRVGAFLDWGTNTTGVRLAWLRVNGATLFAGNGVTPTAQGSPLTCTGVFDLQVGDYVEVIAVQNSGGSITPTGFFTAVRVSQI